MFENKKFYDIFDESIRTKEGRSTAVSTEQYLLQKSKNEGRLETEEKNKTEFVTNLILNTDFEDAKIASLATVSIEFVQKIKASLEKRKK